MFRRNTGFTLVEVLVAIFVIAILIALLLPAVQMARESARMTHCTNNVRQLAQGMLAHHEQQRQFPTSGHHHWTHGDPNLGFGNDQPGGWIYNILPFVEQAAIREIGVGLEGVRLDAALYKAAATPLPLLYCPSRRKALAYPFIYNLGKPKAYLADNCQSCVAGECSVGRTDYQANSGSVNAIPWNDKPRSTQNGVTHRRSRVRVEDIADGASNTYLLGEKHLEPDYYVTGQAGSDDQSAFVGHNMDLNGYCGCDRDSDLAANDGQPQCFVPPRRDGVGAHRDPPWAFGSAHPNRLNMAFSDGSVRRVAYDIDPLVHWKLGARDDGFSLGPTDWER
jgi:prepilin-type N-terminal cleavage/methylation domain-containing protein/prepilin-type processing-associated H-X9-DG protein